MHFLASLVQEVFERILKRHSHIHMKHFQESNHIFPDTSREQIVGWTFNPEVTDLWEAISKQNWSSKLIPTSTLISCFQVQYFSPFCFRAHTQKKNISKKHLRNAKFDMVGFSNHIRVGYFPALDMWAFSLSSQFHHQPITVGIWGHQKHWKSAIFALDHFVHQRGSVNSVHLNAVAATSTRKAWRLTLEL